MYFQKYKPAKVPPGLQRVNHGDVYVMTIYWDKPGDDIWKKSGAPTEFGVQVSDDGEVKLLLSHCREHVRTHTKRGHDWFSIPQQRWGIAKFFQEWAREHKRDPVEHMKSLFFQTTSAFEKAQGLVRVNVGKDEMHAVFSVNVKRTPYFFKDRDVTVTESGRKQRIFHIVREHVRQLEDKEVTVREHFRGLRKFKWNGYQLHITVPGLHHEKIAEFNPAAEDEDANTPLPPGMVTVPIAARMLRDLISGVPIEEARARMKKGLQ
jgi:hypothetical protein